MFYLFQAFYFMQIQSNLFQKNCCVAWTKPPVIFFHTSSEEENVIDEENFVGYFWSPDSPKNGSCGGILGMGFAS